MIFSFIKLIVPQSKAHILRRFLKIGRKVIKYLYVSGQCRQIIAIISNVICHLNLSIVTSLCT